MDVKIAKKIVNESLNVSKDDNVVILTWQHTINLAEALALECRKTGADVLVTLETDTLLSATLRELPVKYLRTPARLTLGLLDTQTVYIYITGPEDPATYKEDIIENFYIFNERDIPVYEKIRAKKVRAVVCSLGKVTPQRAQNYGIDYAAWKSEMHAALDVDYQELKEFGSKLANRLEKARKAHIKAPNNTDLTFEIRRRPVYIYDGVFDKANTNKASGIYDLPSGTVSVAPIETSANGKIFFNLRLSYAGKWLRDLEWSFEGGRVNAFDAQENLALWKSGYEKASGDNDRIGCFNLGINPNAKTGFLHDGIVRGIVGIKIGDNLFQGGENESSYRFTGALSNATVELDGDLLLKDGKYVF